MDITQRQTLIRAHKEMPASAKCGDLVILTGAMKLFGVLNVCQGMLNIALYQWLSDTSSALLMTGGLSVAMGVLVYMKIRFMMHTKSWMEISLTAICGLYLPIFMLVVSAFQMVEGL